MLSIISKIPETNLSLVDDWVLIAIFIILIIIFICVKISSVKNEREIQKLWEEIKYLEE